MIILWPIWVFLYILAVHYVADYILQIKWMRDNKSTSVIALTSHVGVYTTTLFVGMLAIESVWFAMMFAGVNGIIHWFVDGITSKITKRLFVAKQFRIGFDVIGFDQLLHQVTLGVTLMALIRSGIG